MSKQITMEAGPRVNGTTTYGAGILMLAIVAALFLAGQAAINAVNGWWNDELFALWASDTSLPFSRAFAERIAPDSNPPLYFSLLYGARLFVGDDRVAILTLSICLILAGASAVVLASRRSGLGWAAVAAVAAFVLSGPVLNFAPEGRSYLSALIVVFCVSWFAALAVCEVGKRHSVWPFLLLGALASLTHVFAALFCGSLAAGLMAVAGVSPSRRDLVAPALALGVSASTVFAAWLVMVWNSLGNIGWIEFTPQATREAVWYVRKLAVGGWFSVLLLALLLSLGFARSVTRPIVVVFGIAFGLFVALPLVASFKQPLITGRYWTIGAPGLIVLVVMLASIWYREARRADTRRASQCALGGALMLALASSLSGFLAAREFTASKPIWRGEAIVRPLLKDCPTGSVHVGTASIKAPAPLPRFAYMTGREATLFVDAAAPATPQLSAANARCPVLGWAEHLVLGGDYMTRASDADLLRLIKIEASSRAVEIHRHGSGFVVIKREPNR